jgi:hypothetical protein
MLMFMVHGGPHDSVLNFRGVENGGKLVCSDFDMTRRAIVGYSPRSKECGVSLSSARFGIVTTRQ